MRPCFNAKFYEEKNFVSPYTLRISIGKFCRRYYKKIRIVPNREWYVVFCATYAHAQVRRE